MGKNGVHRQFGLSLTLCFILTACGGDRSTAPTSSETPSPKPIIVNKEPALSSSQIQLAQAQYSSDFEKQALSGFMTGQEFCEKFKEITSRENGFYVSVPVDYQDESKGQTQIWAFTTSGTFKPELPSVIFFDGGPGGNSHGWPALFKGYNEIHFDQRGIGCSHPETLELYRSHDYYGNDKSIRDADKIRQTLKIEKLSLYGSSYGTVLATMFASTFPDKTKAVVLDGVVYDNLDTRNITYYLQKMYRSLPEPTKEGMKAYFKKDQLFAVYELAQKLMYSAHPMEQLSALLQIIFPSKDKIDLAQAKKFFTDEKETVSVALKEGKVSAVEGFNLLAVNCQQSTQIRELTLTAFGSDEFDQIQEMTAYKVMNNLSGMCSQIFMKQNPKPYAAIQYPITVPVSYFQGTLDGATYASEATQHYKNVAQKKKQIFISQFSGHCPATAGLGRERNPVLQAIVMKALEGKMSDKTEVEQLNKSIKDNKWVYTSR